MIDNKGVPIHTPEDGVLGNWVAMTLRQYAAIKLKVPDSGTDWLDEMITKSLRDDLAKAAMNGLFSNPDNQVNKVTPQLGYSLADAMMEAGK